MSCWYGGVVVGLVCVWSCLLFRDGFFVVLENGGDNTTFGELGVHCTVG